MGIIRSQSIRSAIITYIGFGIGAINLMFVMPRFFSSEQMGLIQVFIAFAAQVITIGGVGMSVVTNKFLPYYRAHLEPKNRDLLTIVLVVGTIGMLLILALLYFNQDFIIQKFKKNSPLFVEYMYLFPLFSMGYFYYSVFESFNNNYKFSVWSSFVRELFYRFFNLFAALLVAIGFITFSGVMNLYMVMYWMGAILLIGNLYYNKLLYIPFKISRLTKRIRRNIAYYSLPNWGTSILGVILQSVDVFAIAGLVGLGQAAIYNLVKFLISTMVIPSSSIIPISVPLISDAWRRNDLPKIEEIYKKTALVLVLLSGFIFILILSNAKDILHIVPQKFYHNENEVVLAQWTILIIGIARLIDYMTSVNSQILQNSRNYYKTDTICNVVLVIISIPMNYFLVKNWGMVGAAMGSLILSSVLNGFKASYLYVKEKIHPFSKKWLLLALALLLTLAAGYGLELLFNFISFGQYSNAVPILIGKIICKGLLLCLIFVPIVYRYNISDDITITIQNILSKITLFLHKYLIKKS